MPLAFSPWQALRRAWPLHNLRERLNGVFAQSLQELALGRFAHAPAPIVFPRAENPSARLLCALGVGLPDVYPRCLGTLQAIRRLGSSLGLRKLAAVHTPRLWRWRNDSTGGPGVLGDVAKALQARGCGAWGTGPSARWPGQGGPRPGSVGPGVSEGPLGRRQRGATPAGERPAPARSATAPAANPRTAPTARLSRKR